MAVAIRTENLSKRYGSTEVLSALNLEVAEGEVFGYLGPNGAGKSTTIALLLGFIRASAGRAEVLGLDVRRDAQRLHRRVAYVPDGSTLWPSLTGAEALRFLANIHGTVDGGYRDDLIAKAFKSVSAPPSSEAPTSYPRRCSRSRSELLSSHSSPASRR